LFPGKWVENLLIFTAPAQTTGELHLELPGSAFGSSETARLLLPLPWPSSPHVKRHMAPGS
jgi:hypothetical protein